MQKQIKWVIATTEIMLSILKWQELNLLRSLGISYKDLEDMGILLPVTHFQIKYLKPAFYDENLCVRSHIIKLPSTRIFFNYETYNEKKNEKINFKIFGFSKQKLKKTCKFQ